jgi:hypothetical protein
MSSARDRIFGVDFSGSQTPGGDIWITETVHQSTGLEVENCQSAADRFDLPSTASRDRIYQKLQSLVTTQPSTVFGFDFPFSLPEPLIDDVDSWYEHLEEFHRRFGTTSADDFRKRCVGRATVKAGESGYLRRETDWRYGGQCPYQHQIQFQTFYGQRDLLAPLITNDQARGLPMQARDGNLPWLIEVYPAATLGGYGLYRQGYKNRPEASKRRARNIEGFQNQGITISDSIANRCRNSDDAHDSLTAAIAAFNALQNDFPEDDTGTDIEGQIYV